MIFASSGRRTGRLFDIGGDTIAMLATAFIPPSSVRPTSVAPIADDDLVYAGPDDTLNDFGTPLVNPSWTGALMVITARQGSLIWYGFLLSANMDGASRLAEIMQTAVVSHPNVNGDLSAKLPTLDDLPPGWMLINANDQGEYS